MKLLDTDHISELFFPGSAKYANLTTRMTADVGEDFATSIVTVEELMRGWMAAIARERQPRRQIHAYSRLGELFDFFAGWSIIAFDDAAADEFEKQRTGGVRIAATDLKIASVALVNQATLLTANVRDFQKVPGLTIENWLL